MPAPEPHLIATYAAARYEVLGDLPALLLVSDTAGAHDDWLRANNSESAIVITAWNPFSHQLSAKKNELANRHLAGAIESAFRRWVPARGAATGGRWAEDSYCVFDVPDPLLEQWLVRYQQNAAVRVRRGERPELVWHVRFHSHDG